MAIPATNAARGFASLMLMDVRSGDVSFSQYPFNGMRIMEFWRFNRDGDNA